MSSSSHLVPIIHLPMGGELTGSGNPHPPLSECSAIINLQTQVAPLIASMSCQLKVLKLLKPLIDIVKGLPNPSVASLAAFDEAAVDLAPCLLIPTPAVVLPFLRDLLCIEIKSLNCFLQNLQSLLGEAGVNQSRVRCVLDSYPSIVGRLKLAGELFGIAGVSLPDGPILGDGTDPASLEADRDAVVAFTTALQFVADALGGCS